MPLELKIVNSTADMAGYDACREFNRDGGTIGRSLHSDWILPDPDRYISGRHATIDFKGGTYYLADISSNGVYINNEDEPIGKGNPRRLFNGDRLRMGDFEFEVSVDSGESLDMPLEASQTVVPDNIEQRVEEVSLRTGIKLLDEEEITGDEEFQSAMFGSDRKTTPPVPEATPDSEPSIAKEEKKPARAKSGGLQVTAEDLFDSFLDGLGISRVELHPSVSRPEMMLTAGRVLRECVAGFTDMLTSRANLKNAFRLDQTTVLPRHNNPIKLSENANDLLKQLLVGTEGDYLGAEDAIREVSRDLINHQNAFLDAMNSAFIEFADRFDPEELQEGFDRTIGGGKLFAFMNKAKYWQLYGDLYPIMTEKGGGRFPQMFGEEFVRAYERQVTEYQRHDRDGTAASGIYEPLDQAVDPGLLSTQKLDGPVIAESSYDTAGSVKVLTESGALEIDQSFIDELEDSMDKEISLDKLKA